MRLSMAAHSASASGLVPTNKLVGVSLHELERAIESAGPRRLDRPARTSARSARRLRDEVAVAAFDRVWVRIARAFEVLPTSVELDLLDAVLAQRPDHAPAVAATQGLVGELPGPFVRPRDWIAFLRSAEQVPIEFVDVDPGGDREQLSLALARAQWRRDAIGVRSPHLFIVASARHPGGMARCLSVGELVCATLERIFGPPADGAGPRLRIKLFDSREEYLAHSSDRGTDRHRLEWTGGHYSRADGESRMFLPSGDEAFSRVMSVFVHELTHHWIEELCPAIAGRKVPPARAAKQQGYWIVEGFASFVEQFTFDPAARSFASESRDSNCLDVVANAAPVQLLPWDRVLGASQLQAQAFDRRERAVVASSWLLGSARSLSSINMFYYQSAAVCDFLYHGDHGSHRKALLEYLVRYYTGGDRLDIEAAFGMDAAGLGQRTVAHAKLKML